MVAGIRNPWSWTEMAAALPEAHAELLEILTMLERHYGDMQDVEFTVEEGRLYLLQTRNAKRPAQAAVRFAHDAVAEGLLSRERALLTIDADRLDALLHPVFDPESAYEELTRGIPASPGAARGAIVFSAAEAIRRAAEGEDVILVRPFTEADDVAGFHAARGILTAEGGKSSHAALVARGMGRPCVAGASADRRRRGGRRPGRRAGSCTPGDVIAIEGSTGVVTLDDVPLIDPEIGEEFEQVLRWADELRGLGRAGQRRHPRGRRARRGRSAPRASASAAPSTCSSARTAGSWSASMFIAAERWRRAKARLRPRTSGAGSTSTAEAERERVPRGAGPPRRAPARGLRGDLARDGGLPVTIRLLDPPLHEFLPLEHFERRVRELEGEGTARPGEARAGGGDRPRPAGGEPDAGHARDPAGGPLPAAVRDAGAGDRRGGAEAARDGEAPRIEMMLPLIAYEAELEAAAHARS